MFMMAKVNQNIIKLGPKFRYFATSVLGKEDTKKEYYKNIGIVKDADVKPQGWDEARPFSEVPGPKPSPIFGNVWRFILPFGEFYKKDLLGIQRRLHEKYGDVVLLHGIPNVRPVVQIFDPKDVELLFRNEGAWPIRVGLAAISRYRTEIRPEAFKEFPGVLTVHGEEWFKARSPINSILLQPRVMRQYVTKIDEIASELVDNMNYFALQNNGEMPEDFFEELNKWALESIAFVALNKRMGCLQRDLELDSEALTLIRSIKLMFQYLYTLEAVPNAKSILLQSTWNKFVKVMDDITDICSKNIDEAVEKSGLERSDKSVLEKLLRKDKKYAFTMVSDMLMAGIDTTGRIMAATLYYLAKHPDKQQILRDEIKQILPDKNTLVTEDKLNDFKYVDATIKETLRLAPIAMGNLRTTVKDMVLGGYQIPKGTDVIASNLLLSAMDKHYQNAKEFIPERWLRSTTDEFSYKNTHPFVSLPFGVGPRSCVGKRIALLELQVGLIRIMRNFELTWPHEDMVFRCGILYGIDRPLKVHIKPLPN